MTHGLLRGTGRVCADPLLFHTTSRPGPACLVSSQAPASVRMPSNFTEEPARPSLLPSPLSVWRELRCLTRRPLPCHPAHRQLLPAKVGFILLFMCLPPSSLQQCLEVLRTALTHPRCHPSEGGDCCQADGGQMPCAGLGPHPSRRNSTQRKGAERGKEQGSYKTIPKGKSFQVGL